MNAYGGNGCDNRKILKIFTAVIFALSGFMVAENIRGEPLAENVAIKSQNTILVVYFSRSGNTQLLAEEISRYYQASLLVVEAEEYTSGLRGLYRAVLDSKQRRASIKPGSVDLSAYTTLFIGAPIWNGSPAPPVWQFIESNKLTHKKVVLFSTFNSGFKQKYIDEFQARVEVGGGSFISHLYIRRGRTLLQISNEELLTKAREKLEEIEL